MAVLSYRKARRERTDQLRAVARARRRRLQVALVALVDGAVVERQRDAKTASVCGCGRAIHVRPDVVHRHGLTVLADVHDRHGDPDAQRNPIVAVARIHEQRVRHRRDLPLALEARNRDLNPQGRGQDWPVAVSSATPGREIARSSMPRTTGVIRLTDDSSVGAYRFKHPQLGHVYGFDPNWRHGNRRLGGRGHPCPRRRRLQAVCDATSGSWARSDASKPRDHLRLPRRHDHLDIAPTVLLRETSGAYIEDSAVVGPPDRGRVASSCDSSFPQPREISWRRSRTRCLRRPDVPAATTARSRRATTTSNAAAADRRGLHISHRPRIGSSPDTSGSPADAPGSPLPAWRSRPARWPYRSIAIRRVSARQPHLAGRTVGQMGSRRRRRAARRSRGRSALG